MIAREQKIYSKRSPCVSLPVLNRYVKVVPRDKKGNETIAIEYGKFIYETKKLMFLKRDVSYNINYLVAYLKTDLINGIYCYEYLQKKDT